MYKLQMWIRVYCGLCGIKPPIFLDNSAAIAFVKTAFFYSKIHPKFLEGCLEVPNLYIVICNLIQNIKTVPQ